MKTFVSNSSAGRAMRPAALRRNVLQTSLRLALASLPLLAPAAWAQPGAQQQAARAYEIPPGPLAEALSRFGAASGLLISVDARLTTQRQSPGLRGSYGPEEGLHALLAGTGLVAQRTPQGALTLVPAPQADKGALQLAPLRVQGAPSAAGRGLALHAPADEAALAAYREMRSSAHIERETLERFRATSPAEMLKGLPGVQMGDMRNGHSLDVNIRGLQGQSRVAVLVDGSQQSLDVYRGYAGLQQRSYLDPDLIGSVRVDKGPSLNLGGAGAIGGVVSMQTLGVDDVLAAGQASGWRLRGGVAENSVREQPGFKVQNHKGGGELFPLASYFGSLAYARRGEKVDFLAAYVQRRQGNYFAGSKGVEAYSATNFNDGGTRLVLPPVYTNYRPGDEVLNTHSRSRSLLLKSTWRPDADQSLELGLRHTRASYAEIMPSALMRTPASTPTTTYADPEGTMRQFDPGRMQLSALTAQHRWQPAGQSLLDLRSLLWFTRADSLMYNAVVTRAPQFRDGPSIGDPQGSTYAGALRSEVRGQRWGAQLGNTSHFFFGEGQSLEARYGLDYSHEKIGPGPNTPVMEVDLRRNRFVRTAQRQEASLVGSLEWRPHQAWSLQAGARQTHFWVQDLNRQAHVKGKTVRYDEPLRNHGSGFAPTLSAGLRPTEHSLLYARYAEGVRMLGLFESTLGLHLVKLNPLLRPERNQSWELGASISQPGVWLPSDRLSAKLAFFDNRVKDYIVRSFDPQKYSFGLSNLQRFETAGWEFQAAYEGGPVFAQASGSYYQRARSCDAAYAAILRKSSRELQATPDCVDGGFSASYTNTQNPPKFTLNTTLGVRLLERRLSMGMRLVRNSAPLHRLEQTWHTHAGTSLQQYYPATRIVDLFASYKLKPQTELNLAVDNVADRYYLDPLALSPMPAPGRTLRIDFSQRF